MISSDADAIVRWVAQPTAAMLINDLIRSFVDVSPSVAVLEQRLLAETGTRLGDWVDHFGIPNDGGLTKRLQDVGFEPQAKDAASNDGSDTVWHHPGGLFPRLWVRAGSARQIAIRVESVADFVFADRSLGGTTIEGRPLSDVRRATIARDGDHELVVIERNGSQSLSIEEPHANATLDTAMLHHRELFQLRRRSFAQSTDDGRPTGFAKSNQLAFAHASSLIRAAIADIGRDRACHLFFAAERDYWQSRNRAAREQKARQDALGLGWGNHDHHTYRSSREHFAELISILEDLGFVCRERFYAGREAGWGAQVLEQPQARIVVFADVDLSPEEVSGDFAHEPLPPRDVLGTVGIWCRLHGEAFLEAGMHHLECQFDFNAARDQLRDAGIETMAPFTDLPYLRQLFTIGERWVVVPERIDDLLSAGLITQEQADQFRASGTIGSHLEILQRDDGYKGFNESGINDIIHRTDPRHSA